MAALGNTLQTYTTKGIREDLSDLISNISPTETPFTSNAGTRKQAQQTFYEWQLDTLATADLANARPEGDEASFIALTSTTRVGNYCQISRKDIIVSDTDDSVKAAGRKSELAYQTAKKAQELKIDIESICLQRNTGALNTDPRRTATMLSYVRSNVDLGATGVNPIAPAPFYSGNRTDGTVRAFTTTILKNVISIAYTTGMKIDGSVLMLGPAQKGVFSTFTGIATLYKDVPKGQATVVGASDVYISDFGTITVVPNRFQRNKDGWLLDFDKIGFKDLRPYRRTQLAKTGDATKYMLLREWSLQVDNEAGCALAADLQ